MADSLDLTDRAAVVALADSAAIAAAAARRLADECASRARRADSHANTVEAEARRVLELLTPAELVGLERRAFAEFAEGAGLDLGSDVGDLEPWTSEREDLDGVPP